MDITININADVISIIGAVVAFLSMIISWRQAHIAKKSLKMEAAIFMTESQTSPLTLSLTLIVSMTRTKTMCTFVFLFYLRTDRIAP